MGIGKASVSLVHLFCNCKQIYKKEFYRFRITLEELWDGEDIAKCPSCTLRIMVIYETDDLPPLPDDTDSEVEDETREIEQRLEDTLIQQTQQLKVT